MSDNPTSNLANDDMLEGYRDGLADGRAEMPKSFSNRSLSYRHGWLNGRDDRMKKPRASAAEIRRQGTLAAALDALS